MKISLNQTIDMAMGAVWTHKLRSGLTVLGIIIGITTVVTVASLLTGVKGAIVEFFQEFGPDSIFLARLSGDPSGANAPPKELKRRPLDPAAADYLKSVVRSISDVGISLFIDQVPGRVLTAKVPGFESDNLFLEGFTANTYDIIPRELDQGRLFTEQEARRGERVCMLGYSLAEALFPAHDGVGRQVMIDGAEYTVLGVFALAKGGFFGENGLDRQVSMPLVTARMRYPGSKNFFLTAKARPGMRDDAFEEVRAAIRRFRHVPQGQPDDFSLSTPDSIIENFNKITGMILMISIAISAVGLLVGGIGVMNIMLVSVTERTREIGVRKAVGARRVDIVTQFLVEAMTLTGIGGVFGIIVAVLATFLVSALVPSLKTQVPAWAVITGFVVSVSIGVFFGVWPAVKAARLDPVEALRYE
jgi:putative ABC transport system permease protein